MIFMHLSVTSDISALEMKKIIWISMVKYVNASQAANILYFETKCYIEKDTT